MLAVALLAALAAGQGIALSDTFENGNLNGWTFDGVYHNVGTSNPPGTWEWLYFRATGVLGEVPVFRTPVTASGDVYRAYHRMVWRPAGSSQWQFMDVGDRPGDGYYYFSNTSPFTQNEVEIAYWQPYTHGDHVAFVDGLTMLASPYVTRQRVAGTSQQGRDLQRLTVSRELSFSSRRPQVVVIARQHGYESFGNLVLEGMVQFLLSSDPVAHSLRERYVFHFYSMSNPDAVVNGWTRDGRDRTGTTPIDLNRDWQRLSPSTGGIPSATLEVDALREDILCATGGEAAVLLDLHSHAKGSLGLGYYWWYLGDPVLADTLITGAWMHDGAAHAGSTVFSWPVTNPGGNAPTAMAWGAPHVPGTNDYGTLGGLGLTLEPIAAPFGQNQDVDRIRDVGVAIARAIADLP